MNVSSMQPVSIAAGRVLQDSALLTSQWYGGGVDMHFMEWN